MKKKIPVLDPSSVQARLALCAAGLAGTAAAIPTVQATVITNNTPFVVPMTFAGIYLNFLTGVAGTTAGGTPGWDWNPYSTSGGTGPVGFYWAPTPASSNGGVATGPATNVYATLAPGAIINAASNFTNTIAGTANYQSVGTHILGFRFFNEATSAINFGYAVVQNSGATGFPMTIQSYSYENNGGPITVVPEPSTVALLTVSALAMGAVGLRGWRNRRAA